MPVEHTLSPRELQIAKSYAAGATYHIIANELGIAPSTVRTHLAAIYRKLEVSSKIELLVRLDEKPTRPRGDLDAVMPSILRYGLELCDAEFGILFEYRQNRRFCTTFTLGIPAAFQT